MQQTLFSRGFEGDMQWMFSLGSEGEMNRRCFLWALKEKWADDVFSGLKTLKEQVI